MVKQYTENQYDDDLTVGAEDYDDSYYTGSVDLFEFSNDEESPISRLKSLILSIDWEITDDVLMQFNEELVDLRDIWAGEKINLVYIQALEKISKYIYQKKADSHPSAIKLLLTLYHNLEKIVSSYDLTEEQKKEILLEDVKRFENLKQHISNPAAVVDKPKATKSVAGKEPVHIGSERDLLTLKAIVLGIDWEITDEDLNELRKEVVELEEKFAESRPKLILLQGIGTLGAYIKLKKSDAHADAFKILHLFYESLERIVATPMTLAEEKAILFPAVEKFNSFKTLLGPSISSEAISRSGREVEEAGDMTETAIAPAFSDYPEEEITGFQAEEEAKALGIESPESVNDHVESFFMGSNFDTSDASVQEDGSNSVESVDQKIALQGVMVEIDDEEEDVGVQPVSSVSPVSHLDNSAEGEAPGLDLGEESPTETILSDAAEETSDTLDLPAESEEQEVHDFGTLDKETLLQGVDVETEADDDSDEDELPMLGGELAPALVENDEVSIYNAELFENSSEAKDVDEEIAGTLGGFFDEKMDSHISEALKLEDEEFDSKVELTESGGDEETLSDAEMMPASDPGQMELGDEDQDDLFNEDVFGSINSEEELVVEPEGDEEESFFAEKEDANDEDAIAFISDLDSQENLDTFLDTEDLDPDMVESSEPGLLFDGDGEEDHDQEESLSEGVADIDDHLDSFFGLEEDSDLGEEDKLLPQEDDAEKEESLDISLEEESIDPIVARDSEPGLLFDEDAEDKVMQDESDDEVETDIDDHLDSFFGLEDDSDAVGDDQLLFSMQEDAEEDTATTDNLAAAGVVDESEEEVVFELAEEQHEPLLATESAAAEYDETTTGALFVDEDTTEYSTPVTDAEDEDLSDIIDDSEPLMQLNDATEVFGSLQTCVDSLAIELDEKIILGLWGEIDHLDQSLADKPLEKTFLELFKTITRHIDQNRYDSSSDALVLLQSVCEALTALDVDDPFHGQQTLLAETRKVLAWQEALLAQQTAKNEAELTIEDSDALEQQVDQDSTKETTSIDDFSQDSIEAASFNHDIASPVAEEGEKLLSEDLKQEISTLRKSLQDEIAALRKELKGDY